MYRQILLICEPKRLTRNLRVPPTTNGFLQWQCQKQQTNKCYQGIQQSRSQEWRNFKNHTRVTGRKSKAVFTQQSGWVGLVANTDNLCHHRHTIITAAWCAFLLGWHFIATSTNGSRSVFSVGLVWSTYHRSQQQRKKTTGENGRRKIAYRISSWYAAAMFDMVPASFPWTWMGLFLVKLQNCWWMATIMGAEILLDLHVVAQN